jgi:hypothetical protein
VGLVIEQVGGEKKMMEKETARKNVMKEQGEGRGGKVILSKHQ